MPEFFRHLISLKAILFLVFTCFICDNIFSQEIPDEPPTMQVKQFKHSVKAGAGLPVILANEPFKETMEGVYSVLGSADFSIYSPLIVGVYYGYSMFDNAELKGNKGRRADVTKGFFSIAGASMGFEKFIDENKVISACISSGYSRIKYKRSISFTDTITNLYQTEAFNLGITTSYSLVIEETGAIGFFASYRYIDSNFKPEKVQFLARESEKKTHLLTVGILFIYGY